MRPELDEVARLGSPKVVPGGHVLIGTRKRGASTSLSPLKDILEATVEELCLAVGEELLRRARRGRGGL